jgi:hypothetical protein
LRRLLVDAGSVCATADARDDERGHFVRVLGEVPTGVERSVQYRIRIVVVAGGRATARASQARSALRFGHHD